MKEWKFLGQGYHRAVFLLPSKKYVIKIPIHPEGYIDNWLESKRYKKDKSIHASCRLIPYNGFLIMEYIDCIAYTTIYGAKDKSFPEWVFSIDCAQVGYDKNNKLVAYDFA